MSGEPSVLVVGASQETVAAPTALLGLTVVACVKSGPGSLHAERSAATAIHTPGQLNLFDNAHLPAVGAMPRTNPRPIAERAAPGTSETGGAAATLDQQGSCQRNAEP